MTTDTRSGFRLPWTASQGESDDQPAMQEDTPVPEEAQEADMIEAADTPETATTRESADDEPTAAPPARRATKFMAELSRAMQAAAENARAETMSRFEVEAKGVVETIRAAATDEAADLRRKADDDVAAIREWSKAEIARIREETEGRIAARKGELDGEVEQHAATVEARIERVAAVVAAFEAQMNSFFERLSAEEDPTHIATLAETMPDPPSLAEIAASVGAKPAADPVTAHTVGAAHSPVDVDGNADEAASTGEYDFAAAEAEAASFGTDLEDEPELPEPEAAADGTEGSSVETVADVVDVAPSTDADLASSQVIVSGLVSVANIANFKRGLARTAGVSTIGVASGPEGDFIFTVGHTLGTGLTAAVQALPGFDIEITGESDDAINVAAQDRDATD